MDNVEITNMENLIDLAKQGNQEAFSTFYKEYVTPVYRYVYFRVRNQADAEDITQDVFVKTYQHLDRYSYNGTTPLAYLITIARNTLTDHWRKKKTSHLNEDWAMSIADTENLEATTSIKYDAHHVQKKLKLLPEDQQDVIIMKFMNDLSNKEISQALEKTETSVRQLQSRGLKSLRELLNAYE